MSGALYEWIDGLDVSDSGEAEGGGGNGMDGRGISMVGFFCGVCFMCVELCLYCGILCMLRTDCAVVRDQFRFFAFGLIVRCEWRRLRLTRVAD